jgi:hypothetical protein
MVTLAPTACSVVELKCKIKLMLRAYYSKNNGKLMWENPNANSRGILDRARLIRYTDVRNGQPVYLYSYILPTGRTVNINMWRVITAPERKRKPKPVSSVITFAKSAPRAASINGGLARALRDPNGANAVTATMKVLNSNTLMRNLNINNIIKILTLSGGMYPANKLNILRSILVNKLVNNGTSNNIYNASMEVNFTNSQNARLSNALHARGFT